MFSPRLKNPNLKTDTLYKSLFLVLLLLFLKGTDLDIRVASLYASEFWIC